MRRLQVKQVMHTGFYTILLSAVIFFLTGCSNTGSGLDNYPYEPDTPAPAAHERGETEGSQRKSEGSRIWHQE